MLGGKLRDTVSNKFLLKIGKFLGRLGIEPNWVTISAPLLALVAAHYILTANMPMALLFIFLSIFADNVDGAIAKACNKKTLWGGYFDAMMDKYVEVILFCAFALAGHLVPAVLAMGGSLLVSYAKARLAITIPIDNHDWPGIGERADRMLLLILGMAVSCIYPFIYSYSTVSITLYGIAVMTNIGAIQRILYGKGLIKKHEKRGK